jgi:DNA topoisomerase-3
VVEQYHKVQNFVSEPFWYIHVMLERDDFKVEFKWKRNRLFDQQAAVVVYEVCLQNPEATVTAVINKPTTKW